MRSRRFVLSLTALVSAGLLACVLLADEPEEGRRYALIVGVQNYEGAGLGSLHYCDNDAAGLAETLGTVRGRCAIAPWAVRYSLLPLGERGG